MTWIIDNAALLWVAAALLLMVLEVLTLDLFFAMLSVGALAGAVAGWLGAGIGVCVVVAVGVTMLLLAVLRPILLRRVRRQREVRTGTAALVGRSGEVIETVTRQTGLVKLNGETWTARTDDRLPLPVGARGYVLKIEGATAIISATAPVEAPIGRDTRR